MRFGARGSVAARLVLHQEGLNPVVVALLVDPIGDGGTASSGTWNRLRKARVRLSSMWPGQGPQGAVEVLDRLGIEGHLAGVGRG